MFVNVLNYVNLGLYRYLKSSVLLSELFCHYHTKTVDDVAIIFYAEHCNYCAISN